MNSLAELISALTSPKLLMGITLFFPSLLYRSFIIPAMTVSVTLVVKVWEKYREGEDDASFKNESARQVRYGALVLGVVLFFLAAGIAYAMTMPRFLAQFYLIASVTLLAILMVTVGAQTRLSLHTASLGLAVYFIHAFFRQDSMLLVLISYVCLLPFVAWSRIVLGKHTIFQIVVSAILTIFCLLVVGGFLL